jgi:hypothetical protein
MSLHYELAVLEELISVTIHPDELSISRPAEKKLKDWQTLVADETARIKRQFTEQVFNADSEQSIELYIQRHQAVIILLADLLVHYISSKVVVNDFVTIFYKQILLSLEDLLTFIEKRFSRYFDMEATIPASYKVLLKAEMKQKLTRLSQLMNKSKVDFVLVEICQQSIKDFLKTDKPISFREAFYLKELVREILLLEKEEQIDFNSRLLDTLVYLNFNHLRLLTYLTRRIAGEANALSSLPAQIEQLSWHFKNFSQLHIKPGFICFPQQPPFREMILSWLQEEIAFLEKKKQLTMVMPLSQEDVERRIELIQVALSAQQLAFTLKLLIEEKVILNRNQLDLMRRVAKNFKTVGKEQPTAGSIRSKYYNVERSAARTVKDILIKLLNRINKFYIIFVLVNALHCDLPGIVPVPS